MKKILCLLAALSCLLPGLGQLRITVTNPSGFAREGLAEVALDSLGALPPEFRITGPGGKETAWQLTRDGLLLFPVSLPAGASQAFTIEEGPTAPAEREVAWTFRIDRLDDFAWENSHAGYRLYGPAFRREEGGVYGYDIWCKRGAEPVLDTFYDGNSATPQISYHEDHGLGFDGFAVGPTLGAGGFVLTPGDSLLYRECYRTYEVVDSGPLRLTVRFTIDPFELDGREITEVRTLTLDAGSHFNRVATEYRGLSAPCPAAGGIVVHKGAELKLMPELKAIAVSDPTDRPAGESGRIFIGLVYPEASSVSLRPEKSWNTEGQALAEGTAQPGQPSRYYWGSGWSLREDCPDFGAWQLLVERQAEAAANPLRVTVER